jgi:hypothetical protein
MILRMVSSTQAQSRAVGHARRHIFSVQFARRSPSPLPLQFTGHRQSPAGKFKRLYREARSVTIRINQSACVQRSAKAASGSRANGKKIDRRATSLPYWG